MIENLGQNQAFAFGALRADLGEEVEITIKDKLHEGVAARTSEHIQYIEGRPALVMFDHDTKGMPDAVRQRIAALGGFWPALVSVLPQLTTPPASHAHPRALD